MIKGIGCDIVEHERVNIKIAHLILSEDEIDEFNLRKEKIEYLASRFAAKEAIIKATNKKYLMKEITLCNNSDGGIESNIEGIHISISHERRYSIAMAIWEENDKNTIRN